MQISCIVNGKYTVWQEDEEKFLVTKFREKRIEFCGKQKECIEYAKADLKKEQKGGSVYA